jgi:hypothetical protein
MGRSSNAVMPGAFDAVVVAVVPAGQVAPSSIHRLSVATSASLSASPRIGMAGASSPATWRYIRLCSALPGTSEGPWAPPSMADARVRRSSFESFSFSPWQPRHFAWRMGWTSVANSTVR